MSVAEDEYGGDYPVSGHYIKCNKSVYRLQRDKTNLEIVSGREILYVTYSDRNYYLTHNLYGADDILSDFVENPDSYSIFYIIKGINATCLTDNVIKTLPQTLSDSAKNQVKENLGIKEDILDFPYGFSKENNPDLKWIRIEVDDTDSVEGIIERGEYGYAYVDVTLEDGKRCLYSSAFDGDVYLGGIEISINEHSVWVDTTNGQTCTGVVYIFYSSTPIESSFIKKLDTICLPEFTTLSNGLSDSDKNQALANLGIDPVVWKYMCEPFKLENGVKIPQELHNIIWDNKLSKLKPISSKLLITDTRIIDYIGSDFVEVSSIGLRYEYNAADNIFVEFV